MIQKPQADGLERPTFPLWQRAVLFSLGYFLCAVLGRALSAPGVVNVSFWLPSGLFLAVLLRNPTRDWKWLILAVLPAGVVFELLHQPEPNPWLILNFYVSNVLRALTGAWLVRRWVAASPTLRTLGEFFGLITFGGIVSGFLGALMGSLALMGQGVSEEFFVPFLRWWASSAMSVLVFTPFLLTWINPPPGKMVPPWRVRREVEVTVLFLGLTVSAWGLLVAGGGINHSKVPLMLFPLWAGLRFGVRGAAATLLWLAVWTSFLTTHYLTGLTAEDIANQHYIVTLQIFLSVAALVALVPAILLSERDVTLARLRESEARYRNLTRAAFEGIVISEQGRIVDVNQQCLDQLACRREDMIGRALLDFVAPSSRASAARMIAERQERMIEYCLLRSDGSQFEAEVQSKILQIGDRAVGMIAIRDITERKLAEEARRLSEEKFTKAFLASPDGLAISELVTGRFIEVNEGSCRLYDCPRDEMLGRTSVELGFWENPKDREQLVQTLQATGRLRNVEIRVRTRAGKIKTVLLSSEPIEMGAKTCIVTALHDISDRKMAEAALRESEAIQRDILNSLPAHIAVLDKTGVILAVNEPWLKFARENGNTGIGKVGQAANYFEVCRSACHGGDSSAKAAVDGLWSVLSGTQSRFSLEYPCDAPGCPRWFAMEVLRSVGQHEGAVVAHTEITERRQAEVARREALARLEKIASQVPGVVYQFRLRPDGTSCFPFASEAIREIYRVSPDEVRENATKVFGIIHPEDRDDILASIQASARDLTPWHQEYRVKFPDGTVRWLDGNSLAQREADGATLWHGFITDITERKQAEATLQESQQRLRMVLQDANIGLWNWDLKTDRVDYSKEWKSQLGYKEHEIGDPLDEWLTRLHPDDYARTLAKHRQFIERPWPDFEVEFRLRHKDGSWRWILSRATDLCDAAGKAERLLGIHVDITERKLAEAEREAAVAREQQARSEYTLQLIATQEAERKRIATELHDSLGQNLLLIKNFAQMVLRDKRPEQTYEQVANIDQLAAQCLAEARQISRDLHPPQLDHLGLKRSLELLLENVAQASEIRFDWKINDTEKIFSAPEDLSFYRIVQESLNNILKHSRAQHVQVTLERDVHEVLLSISDDGCGFDLNRMAGNRQGMGVQNIIERVRMLGGRVQLDTAPGRGTRVVVTVPIAAEPE
jgi:PAS domain S-box-containing protein